jgi:riboflavin kinase/FMN adenylyltransferase
MGAQLGYPTANIKTSITHKILPGNGVYLVESNLDGIKYYGMANMGLRPTLTNDIKPTLEVNYLDFDDDLYDQELEVFFLDFIRPEKKFESSDELRQQIRRDEKQVRRLIKHKFTDSN